jgi:hypothetical protein
MNNRNMWIIAGLIVLSAVAIILVERSQKSEQPIVNSMSDVIDSAGDGFRELKEEVKDEIDDHTDER